METLTGSGFTCTFIGEKDNGSAFYMYITNYKSIKGEGPGQVRFLLLPV